MRFLDRSDEEKFKSFKEKAEQLIKNDNSTNFKSSYFAMRTMVKQTLDEDLLIKYKNVVDFYQGKLASDCYRYKPLSLRCEQKKSTYDKKFKKEIIKKCKTEDEKQSKLLFKFLNKPYENSWSKYDLICEKLNLFNSMKSVLINKIGK